MSIPSEARDYSEIIASYWFSEFPEDTTIDGVTDAVFDGIQRGLGNCNGPDPYCPNGLEMDASLPCVEAARQFGPTVPEGTDIERAQIKTIVAAVHGRKKDRVKSIQEICALCQNCESIKALCDKQSCPLHVERDASEILLEDLPAKFKADSVILNRHDIKVVLADLQKKDKLKFEILLKQMGIKTDVKKALLADLDKIDICPEEDNNSTSDEIRAKAGAILESGNPIKARCDYVARYVHSDGDAERALVFSVNSIYMPKRDKLHSDISGSSQAGKSERAGAVHATYPPENVISLTEASPKSLYYLAQQLKKEGKSLDDTLIYVDDARLDHIPVLKVFRNDGPVDPRNLTVVDGAVSDQQVPGHPVVQASSVVPLRDFDEQNTSRTFLISVPDADEATERKVRAKIRHRLEYGALQKESNDEDKTILQEMARIIRDDGIRDVVIPFDVVEPKSADRRGTGQFLRLIKISAHENQYQRPILEMKDGSRYILATYADLEAAAEVWFSFEEAQAYKITDKSLQVFRKLNVIEPSHDRICPTSHTKNVLAEITGIGPKTTERLLTDLYDAGLIFKKQVAAPGQPFVYWTTPELRQKVMSQISATCGPQTELGQIKTKNGCPKYLRLNCPDSLKTSIYSFFTNQDIIKKEMLSEIKRRHVGREESCLIPRGEIISSVSKVQNLVLNGVLKPLDSDSLGRGEMSQIDETDETEPLDSDSLGRCENVSKGNVTVPKESCFSINEQLAQAEERQKEKDEHFKTPPTKPKLRLVRFLETVPAFMGMDGNRYGPFDPDDLANIPEIHADNLITKNAAVGVNE